MKPGMMWPIAMASILAITVAANIAVAVVANDDPSFVIEKDYYRRAVDWDREMAQERANQSLGWRLVPELGAFSARDGAVLGVRLADAAGAPISGATVKVSAFFVARSADVAEASLAPAGAGAYAVTLPVRHAGQWELRFDATRGRDHFTSVARLDAVPGHAVVAVRSAESRAPSADSREPRAESR